MNKKTRDDAIEGLLVEANAPYPDVHYVEFCDSVAATRLASAAWMAVGSQYSSHEEDCLEAAQLLIEGWNPGDKVVKL